MKLFFAGALLLSVSVLGGCTKYWYQDGKSFKQTQVDLSACQTEAVRYSDVRRTYGVGSYEEKFVRRCMEQRGYQLVREKDLPMRVRRESSPVFGMAGVAGTID